MSLSAKSQNWRLYNKISLTTAQNIMENITSPKLIRNEHIKNIRFSLRKIEVINHNHQLVEEKLSSYQKEGSDSENTVSSPNIIQRENQYQIVEVFNRKYELLEKIGEGSDGVVHRCRKRLSGEVFAVKTFVVQEEHIKHLIENFKGLSSLVHPNIISCKALYIDMKKHEGWLVMEFIEGVPLHKVELKEEKQLKQVMQQILSAICYIHENGIVHRDIKPQNIICDQKTKKIKLIDFGVSKMFSKEAALWSNTGTLYYKAPEMFEGGYREKVDIWAAGILLYKLICGSTPFQSEYHSQTIYNIKNRELSFPTIFSEYSPDLKILISTMLIKNDSDRPSAKICLKDTWLKDELHNLQQFLQESPLFSPMKKQKKIKRKFSDLCSGKAYFPLGTRKYIFDLHCLDSEWEEDS